MQQHVGYRGIADSGAASARQINGSWTGCIGRRLRRLLDGYWERNLQPWDIAAGQIVVREAGGTISGIEGSDDPLKTGHVLCGNEYVHGELVKILKALDK
jgi:hypothetical protein